VTLLRFLAAAAAAAIAAVLAGCAGSDNGGPAELLVVSTRDGDYAIYGMSADGGGEERLTEESGDPATPAGLFFQIEPAWSPDGTRIAFASKREGNFDIYVMSADGSETVRLTSTPEDDSHPSWSDDGERIVFSRGAPGDLWIMNADGSEARALLRDGAADTQPTWSPDGALIAFTRRQPGTSIRELWLMQPDGSGVRPLTTLQAVSDDPGWAPDSATIAFATNVLNNQFDVYTVAVDGGRPRRVTVTSVDSFEPAWSPDGTAIAYSEEGAIHAKQVGSETSPEATQLTDPAGNDSSPAWRPASPAG
jgi:Tol biopolymer transport system component